MASQTHSQYAAGLYWISKTNQAGPDYVRPLPVNESGAYIWEKLQSGERPEQIAEDMSAKYEIPYQTACEDVKAFSKQLHEKGFLQ